MHDRFGMGPEYWHNMPVHRRDYWLKLAAIEGEVAAEWAEASSGMSADDEIVIYEYELLGEKFPEPEVVEEGTNG